MAGTTSGRAGRGPAWPHAAAPTENRTGGAAKDKGVEGELDARLVVARLEEAGRTLLALPPGGYSTGLRTNAAALLRHMIEAGEGDPAPGRLHPAVPSAGLITRMDEALGWIPLIPRDRSVLRRIVGARALVNPVTDRYLYPWRRLGVLLGADHKAVQRWHAQGIDIILAHLRGGSPRPRG